MVDPYGRGRTTAADERYDRTGTEIVQSSGRDYSFPGAGDQGDVHKVAPRDVSDVVAAL